MINQKLKIGNWFLRIILIGIILSLPLYLFRFSVLGVPTNVMEVIIYLAFIVWLVIRWFNRQNNKINWRLPWVVWVWVVVGIIAALMNPDMLSGLGYWRAYFFDPLLVILIIANEYQLSKIIIPRVLIIIGLIISFISCAGFWGWHVASDGRHLGWFGLDGGASPNYLSLFLVPIISLSIVSIFTWKNDWWRYLAVASTIVSAVALWGTQSRGALVGIVGGIIIAFLWWHFREEKHKYRWLGLSSIVLILLVIATFWLAKPDFMASPNDGRVATSNNVRWYIWQTSIEMIKQEPLLGVGLGNYQNYFTELTKDRVNYPEFIAPLAYSAHNLYLHILVSMGAIGLVVLIWLIVIIIKKLSNAPRSLELLLAVVALSSILFYGLVDTPYFKNDLATLWWIFVALIIYYKNGQGQKEKNH